MDLEVCSDGDEQGDCFFSPKAASPLELDMRRQKGCSARAVKLEARNTRMAGSALSLSRTQPHRT